MRVLVTAVLLFVTVIVPRNADAQTPLRIIAIDMAPGKENMAKAFGATDFTVLRAACTVARTPGGIRLRCSATEISR